ncbi:MAG: Nif3-like dinuclear metal center hexameric protein [Bacteroidetes bacterium]|nr:Nif3-like dinuclear metal center hexameric protein [Bacteroidota bacterium]
MVNQNDPPEDITRRKFIRNTGVAAAGIALTAPLAGKAANLFEPDTPVTVKQIVDKFIAEVGVGNIPNTVDTLKSGSPDMVVTSVLTTMFATIDMIRKAISLNANFIIAHEPTFYNHQDNTDWLKDDDVYQYKADLLKQHNITIWRNHDYIHTHKPDGVLKAQLEQLEWTDYADKDFPNLLTMQSTPLRDLVHQAKVKLNIDTVRYIGDMSELCRRVLFLEGAPGGMRQIEAIMKYRPNAVFCGEISEWETAEYVRDARAKGDNLSLIVLGHIASEERGSQFMLEWMKKNFPAIKTTHVSPGNSLKFM